MKAFEFASPDSVADALKALAGAKDATVLSGGVDLVNRMKDYIDSPSRVVSVTKLEPVHALSPPPSVPAHNIPRESTHNALM